MAGSSSRSADSVRFSSIENLESRLLLTTMYGGDVFVYHNLAGDEITLTLTGDSTDCIEVMAQDVTSKDVINMPGRLNGNSVNWPDGTPVWVGGANPHWAEYADNAPLLGQYGTSRAEIYSIYVVHATEDTRITLSATTVWANANVMLGCLPALLPDGTITYGLGGDTGIDVSPLNMFPGATSGVNQDGDPVGGLAPGVLVASGAVFSSTGLLSGGDIHAIAHNSAQDVGNLAEVDQTYFRGTVIVAGTGLGTAVTTVAGVNNITSVASDSTGVFFSEVNVPSVSIPATLGGGNVQAIACGAGGIVYSYDETNSSLGVYDTGANPQFQVFGRVQTALTSVIIVTVTGATGGQGVLLNGSYVDSGLVHDGKPVYEFGSDAVLQWNANRWELTDGGVLVYFGTAGLDLPENLTSAGDANYTGTPAVSAASRKYYGGVQFDRVRALDTNPADPSDLWGIAMGVSDGSGGVSEDRSSLPAVPVLIHIKTAVDPSNPNVAVVDEWYTLLNVDGTALPANTNYTGLAMDADGNYWLFDANGNTLAQVLASSFNAVAHTASVNTPFFLRDSAGGAIITGVQGLDIVGTKMYVITPTVGAIAGKIYCLASPVAAAPNASYAPQVTITSAAGASAGNINGTYTYAGVVNGHPSYTFTNGGTTVTLSYSGARWEIRDQANTLLYFTLPGDQPFQVYTSNGQAGYAGGPSASPTVLGYARLALPPAAAGQPTLTAVTALAADFVNHPGYFLTAQAGQLVYVPIASQLESLNKGTWDPTQAVTWDPTLITAGVQGQSLGVGNVAFQDVVALAFDNADVLYAVATYHDWGTDTLKSALITINTATGAATYIGDLLDTVISLAHSFQGGVATLYGLTSAGHLVTIATNNAAIVDVALVTSGLTVAGAAGAAGTAMNGEYSATGSLNGKPVYTFDVNTLQYVDQGGGVFRWELYNGGVLQYAGANNADLPLALAAVGNADFEGAADITVTPPTSIGFVPIADGPAGAINYALFGTTAAGALYAIDAATGGATLLGSTGITGPVSLTFDPTDPQPDFLWSTFTGADDIRLVQINLAATLLTLDSDDAYEVSGIAMPDISSATVAGYLFDHDQIAYVWTNIHGLDFDGTDELYASGTLVNIDPYHVAAPPAAAQLFHIDFVVQGADNLYTGEQVLALNNNLATAGFDDAGLLWGVDEVTGTLVTIDLTANPLAESIGAALTYNLEPVIITGLDFHNGTAYAVSADKVFTVNLVTGACHLITDLSDIKLTLTGLASNPDPNSDSDFLYATATDGLGHSYTVLVSGDPKATIVNLGIFDAAATVGGAFVATGNVDTLEVGYLQANVRIGSNLGDFITRDGNAGGQYIVAAGAIRMIDSRVSSNVAILSQHNGGVQAGQTALTELESLGLLGADYDNDSPIHAQYLSCPWGAFTLNGVMGLGDEDWYAIPLMAGQTIVIDGEVDGNDSLYDSFVKAYLYDPSTTRLMDTLGYESVEDEGIGSRGDNQKALTFTAPSPGVYYLKIIWHSEEAEGNSYLLDFTGGPTSYLGGVNVEGNIDRTVLPESYDPVGYSILAQHGGGIGGITASGNIYSWISSSGKGDLVAVQAADIGLFTDPDSDNHARTYIRSESNIGMVMTTGGDALVRIYAGTAAVNPDANLERVEIHGNLLTDPFYSTSNSSPMNPTIASSGNIGIIQVTGNVGGVKISANYDGAGKSACHVDLIQVGGDWGHLEAGASAVPFISHGPGGNIGYITIGGTIYQIYGTYITEATVNTYSDGKARTVHDDGGGVLTITPTATTLLDAAGKPIIDPATKKAKTYLPTYSYVVIGVDDDSYPGVGVGGVITRLTATGSVSLSTSGHVDISFLDLTPAGATATSTYAVTGATGRDGMLVNGTYADSGVDLNGQPIYTKGTYTLQFDGAQWELYIGSTLLYAGPMAAMESIAGRTYQGTAVAAASAGATPTMEFSLSGKGEIDVYYAQYTGAAGTINFTNSTPNGDLVSGNFAGSLTMYVTGSVGARTGSTNTRLFGYEAAPDDGPGFGWYNGTLNGLRVTGTLTSLRANGSIGDLDVTGEITYVLANADSVTAAGKWDGIDGVVFSGTRIGAIYVGDGLRDDGAAEVPQAAIMTSGSIGLVYVSGTRYIRNNVVFHELQGAIIGQMDETLPISSGSTRTKRVSAVDSIIGVKGAQCTALIGGLNFEAWRVIDLPLPLFTVMGSVNTVNFSGAGASIHGSEIHGTFVRNVITSADSDGITNCHIIGANPPGATLAVELVQAGGAGLRNSTIEANGMGIGTIQGSGTVADMVETVVTSSDGLSRVTFRDIDETEFHVTNKIGSITATRDFKDVLIRAGAVRTMAVTRNWETSNVWFADTVDSITVGGTFGNTLDNSDNILSLNGPTTAHLRSMVVRGDIGGTIRSAGKIGTIQSTAGAIGADITTLGGGWSGDVDTISAGTSISGGTISVAGTLNRLISARTMGSDPRNNGGASETLDVTGNLNYLRVDAGGGTLGDLFTNINVGRNIGTVQIAGTLYGDIRGNGNADSVTIRGAFGGSLVIDNVPTDFGCLDVLGSINRLSLPSGRDLVADLREGGDIASIYLSGGNLIGDIESRHGKIGYISIVNGSIQNTSSIKAESITSISVTNGNVLAPIETTNGNLGSLTITNGILDANVTVANGDLPTLRITGRNGNALTANATVTVDGSLTTATVTGGPLAGNLLVGQKLGYLTVRGGDLTGDIDAGVGITSLTFDGTLNGGFVRTPGAIGTVTGKHMNNAILSGGFGLGRLYFSGNVVGSFILSGYDVGADGLIATLDDNSSFGGNVHCGNIDSLTITGTYDSSITAAGVGPDAVFGMYVRNDAQTATINAAGTSNITSLRIGAYANPNQSGVLADSIIDAAWMARPRPAALIVSSGADAPVAGVGATFGPASVGRNTRLTDNGAVLSLTGAGVAYYDNNTGAIVLQGTTVSSALTIGGTAANVYTVQGSEDCLLGSLTVNGSAILGDVSIDGRLSRLTASAVDNNATMTLPGGSDSITLTTNGATLTLNAGKVGTATFNGGVGGGTLTFDTLATLTVKGALDADVTVLYSGASSVSITGDVTGDITFQQSVGYFNVTGQFMGTLTITDGDLTTFRCGDLSGIVTVGGKVGAATVATGDFSGSFRAARGIGTFTVSVGSFTVAGVLGTHGGITSVSVRNAAFAGRIGASLCINSVYFFSMETGGLVSAGKDLLTATILHDMTGSVLVAGLDTGDSGYDAVNFEDGNYTFDAFTAAALQNAQNTDSLGGGKITSVTIGGDMTASSIAAAVGPGADGYFGTYDDRLAGVGTVGTVRVAGQIMGSWNAAESYGVYAAGNMPTVTSQGQPFTSDGFNFNVAQIASMAGNLLTIKKVSFLSASSDIVVTFNRPIDFSTFHSLFTNPLLPATVTVVASINNTYGDADDTDITALIDHSFSYDPTTYQLTLHLTDYSWDTLNYGTSYQLTIQDTVLDNQGDQLDGEYTNTFPTGDGLPGGDFIYELNLAGSGHSFGGATDVNPVVDGPTIRYGGEFVSEDDINVFEFVGTKWNFIAAGVETDSGDNVNICLFLLDNQGTVTTADDFYEQVTSYSYNSSFAAFELPADGTYYLLVASMGYESNDQYILSLTAASTDANLIAGVGVANWPDDTQIAYVSAMGQNGATLGGGVRKQLVYLNFNKDNTQQQFADEGVTNLAVAAFTGSMLDPALSGYTSTLKTNIVNNIVSIFQDIPATQPAPNTLNVHLIGNQADWDAYVAAPNGLYFIVDNPTKYDSSLVRATDFTTLYIGSADDSQFTGVSGSLLGIACRVDVNNTHKGDAAVIFAQNYAGESTATTVNGKIEDYSFALANCIAHELGHTLGLNHHNTDWEHYQLVADDADNNDATPDDSNQGTSLMAYATMEEDMSATAQLGTARIETNEFPGNGNITVRCYADDLQQLIWWLG